MILAAKCPPEEIMLSRVEEVGIGAVELYIRSDFLHVKQATAACRKFPFRYAVHAPTDGHDPFSLSELVREIKAEIVVFHDIYWEDEWKEIAETFKGLEATLCVENVRSVHDPVKLMRRFGMGRCLDLEHLQVECAGIYEEAFMPFIRQANHIHLTGYFFGSNLWHTHIHQSPTHAAYLLQLLQRADYRGFVVSEARDSLQTLDEFRKLRDFFEKWTIESSR
jgi:hypothetical protein